MLYPLLVLNCICTLIPVVMQDKKLALKLSMIILFLFLGLRYNFGNDYASYYNAFYGNNVTVLVGSGIEYGYALLSSVFQPLGFFSLVFFTSLIFIVSLYLTIRRYVSPKFYWLMIFGIISNPDLIFFGASAIRQTLALSIIFFSLPFLQKRKLILFAAFVLLASLFHKSALIFLIILPLLYVNLNSTRNIILIALISIGIMTIFKGNFRQFVDIILVDNFSKYADRYMESEEVIGGAGFGIIIRLIWFCFFLWGLKVEHSKLKSIFIVLSIFCVVIYTMRDFVSLQRLTLYLGYFVSMSLIYILRFLKRRNELLFYCLLTLILVWNVNMAISFASQTDSYFNYHTIFESDYIFIK